MLSWSWTETRFQERSEEEKEDEKSSEPVEYAAPVAEKFIDIGTINVPCDACCLLDVSHEVARMQMSFFATSDSIFTTHTAPDASLTCGSTSVFFPTKSNPIRDRRV